MYAFNNSDMESDESTLQDVPSSAEQLSTSDKKVTHSATKMLQMVPFNELCQMYKLFLTSPECDRVYPEFITHKWDKQNFRKGVSNFRFDPDRQKLFRCYVDTMGTGKCAYELFYYVNKCNCQN